LETLNVPGPTPTLLLALGTPWDAFAFLGSILMVAFGLGFVIFLHELGHFLVAKWAGVHVKAFSIGFPPTLVSWRRGLGFRLGSSVKEYEALLQAEREGHQTRDVHALGETEYVLSWIPLGGYVSMVGEDPRDSEGAADPRAFANKPVLSRMAIISAGVTMNLILGLTCFVASYKLGMTETPALIGHVLPGTPAYEAGVRVGDEIVGMDGRKNPTFRNFQMRIALSGKGDVVHLDLKRPGRAEPFRVDVEPRRDAERSMPIIGLAAAGGLELEEAPAKALPGAVVPGAKGGGAALQDGDRLVKIGPALGTLESVGPEGDPEAMLTLNRLLVGLRSQPVTVEVRRNAKRGGAKGAPGARPELVEVTVPPRRFLDLGLIPSFGPITSLAHESPAEAAGFRKGDTIVKVEGFEPLDPMRLPDFCLDHAGEALTVEVLHTEAGLDRTRTLKVTPDASPPWVTANATGKLIGVPGLGLAYTVTPKVAGVRQGSPAQGKVQPGDVLRLVTFPMPDPPQRQSWIDQILMKRPKRPELAMKDDSAPWALAFARFQDSPGIYSLAFEGKAGTVDLELAPVEGWYNPDRGLRFGGLKRPLPPQTVAQSVRRGWDDTVESIYSTYATVRGLIQGRVGGDNIAGPIRIFGAGRQIASSGLAPFFNFLGLLSVNLAVINFLPIPPLDGGQMAFLTAEGIRGRPLPDSAINAGQMAGLALVLCLMVFVFGQDIYLTLTS